jgi:ParB-like chromosome segregation protein Spo0J
MIDATTLELPLGEHTVPLALLSPASENANKGSIARVVESLSEFGQHRRLVVRQANREIIVGNHTYMAAKTLGWESIDVLVVDDDETKAIRRAIADNATRRSRRMGQGTPRGAA